MLFRVRVFVVRAIRSGPYAATDGWEEAVYYSFGINASDSGAAAEIATRAAEHAVGRGGDYIGGVVAEMLVRGVAAEEFEDCNAYLLQPLTDPGIFYVTGETHTSATGPLIAGAAELLAQHRESIRHQGIPTASFVHPPLPNVGRSKKTRLVCPDCGAWSEFDETGVIYSLFTGLDPESDEAELGRAAGHVMEEFIQEHSQCLIGYEEPAMLVFLRDDDQQYGQLDPAKRV